MIIIKSRAILLLPLLIAVWINGITYAAITVNQDYLDIAGISDSDLNSMRNLKILFGCQSVGGNTLNGLTDLALQNSRYQLTISQVSSAGDFNSAKLGHFLVGSNGNPIGKISDFDSKVRNTFGTVTQVAFFKFCPFDITSNTDVNSIFDTCKNTMEALKSSYPNIIFVHLTCPLTTWEDTTNVKRNQLNTLLLNEYDGKDYVFDIAAIESAHEDETRATFSSGGQTYYKLCSEYTTDNVHLNDSLNIGRQRAAKGMIYLLSTIASTLHSTTYYVSNAGDDNNSGINPDEPWKTINKINSFNFSAGDTIYFKKGDAWRENLVPFSGSVDGYITYTSYGNGEKPLLLGSIEKNNYDDWVNEGGNIWSINPAVVGNELLANPSFTTDTSSWVMTVQPGSGAIATGGMDTVDYDSDPASYKIECVNNGSAWSHIRLHTSNLSITEGKYYKLSFRAKCTAAFTIPLINLIKGTSPYSQYYITGASSTLNPPVTANWTTSTIFYKANATVFDAMLVFFFGNSLPDGATFHIDTLSFQEVEGIPCYVDVGNIIFNNGQTCGIKVWQESDLDMQDKFWYDTTNRILKIHSTQNPTDLYNDIECAITGHIIDESNRSYVIYEDLHLAYGGAHGIGGPSTHHIIVRNCDICFIGGGRQSVAPPGAPVPDVRYGNGVEFWDNANNNLVEGCNIWEIYDNALTNQGRSENNAQYNIIYRNNKIWNCERPIEYWNYPNTSITHDILIENNISINAGGGWAHLQRPDTNNGHLCSWGNTAQIYNFYVRNNIFIKADQAIVWFWGSNGVPNFNGLENVVIDYNTYYQTEGKQVAFWANVIYNTSDFSAYQNDTGKDTHSQLVTLNSISVAPANVVLNVDDNNTCQLTANLILSNGNSVEFTRIVPYSSSDSAIVMVNPTGLVTAVGAGHALITLVYEGVNTVVPVIVNELLLNNPPVLAAIGDKIIDEGENLNFTIYTTDADGDEISYSIIGLPIGASFDSITQTFSWTPTYEQAGEYLVNFTVTDNKESDSETITITVNNVNQTPTVTLSAIPTSGVVPLQVSFIANVYDTDGIIVSYEWDFDGNGTFDKTDTTTNIARNIYMKEGVYVAKVRVQHRSGGLVTSQPVTITVSAGPVMGNIDTSSPGSALRVDGFDLYALSIAFGTTPQDHGWNQLADLDGDGKAIDGNDLVILAVNFGRKLQ